MLDWKITKHELILDIELYVATTATDIQRVDCVLVANYFLINRLVSTKCC